MYSDELEAVRPRPAIDFNPDAPMVAEGTVDEAEQRWRKDFQNRITPPAPTSPSSDRDLGEEESVLKTME